MWKTAFKKFEGHIPFHTHWCYRPGDLIDPWSHFDIPDGFNIEESCASCFNGEIGFWWICYTLSQWAERHLQKTSSETSQKCLQGTAKITCKAVFKTSKRQLFCKSSQCLSKPLFRQLIHTFALIHHNCLGRIAGCFAINFCDFQG